MKKRIIISMLIILNAQAARQDIRLLGDCLLDDAQVFLWTHHELSPKKLAVCGKKVISCNDQEIVTALLSRLSKEDFLKYKLNLIKKNNKIALQEQADNERQEQDYQRWLITQQKQTASERRERRERKPVSFHASACLKHAPAGKAQQPIAVFSESEKEALRNTLLVDGLKVTRGAIATLMRS